MAEHVAVQQEITTSEYKMLGKYTKMNDENLRDVVKTREDFENKLSGKNKSITVYGEYIIFEKNILTLVTQSEEMHGAPLDDSLKTLILERILRLYRDGTHNYPIDYRIWDAYIKFCKTALPHEVAGVYEKYLSHHGDRPHVWCSSITWNHEHGMEMAEVKQIFIRACRRHPSSELIYCTFLGTMLEDTANMNTSKTLRNGTTSEQSIGMERINEVFKSARKTIRKPTFLFSVLSQCEEDKYCVFTAHLQKMILDDLMKLCPKDEHLWDMLAQRELRGFCMSDLEQFLQTQTPGAKKSAPGAKKSTPGAKKSAPGAKKSAPGTKKSAPGAKANSVDAPEIAGTEETEKDDDHEDVKHPNLGGWRKKSTFEHRVELCNKVYIVAVRTLKTAKMTSFHIDTMLKLNQDMSTLSEPKMRCLVNAFKEGHAARNMSEDHYCALLKIFIRNESSYRVALEILPIATKLHNSPKLYELWLSIYISENCEPKLYETFRLAVRKLSPTQAIPLWTTVIHFYQTRYSDKFNTLQSLLKEASLHKSSEFGIFRTKYLDWCVVNLNIEKTRCQYDEMTKCSPLCLQLHQRMAQIESYNVKPNIRRWRLCHENAANYSGQTSIDVWMDYIQFEKKYGDPKLVTVLYQRANKTLKAELVAGFIEQEILLDAKI